MTAPAPGLAQMNERMQQWMAEKPTGGNFNPTELNLQQNDLVIFQFASSGQDGDRLIKAYRSHIFGQVSPRGKRFNETRYCAIQNGDGQECAFCGAGHTDIKERMSMWLLVHQILHAAMPQVQQGQPLPDWPIVQYEGNNYYMEQVNAWKIWHTSAWRESPWTDICRTASMYGSLHAFTAQILCTGQNTAKRFKFYVLPNSQVLPPDYYQQAWDQLTPIPDMLRAEMTRPVRQNPQPQQAVWGQSQPIANPTNFSPGGFQSPAAVPMPPMQPVQPVAVFAPPAAPAPVLQMAPPPPPPLAVAPTPAPATFQPASQPAAAQVFSPGQPQAAPVAAPAPQPVAEAPAAPLQAVAAPVAPPPPAAPVMPPAAPVAPPAVPAAAPALPATPPPAPSVPAGVQQAPDDGRRPMRAMF